MGLSLNNIYQRPYVKQDLPNRVKKRDEDEKSAATNAQREQESGQNSKSKGLQYVEQKAPTYTPAYEQKFSMPAQTGYASVNINSAQNSQQNTATTQAKNIEQTQAGKLDNQINIAQILKDFKNTAIAIGTPDDLNEIVDGYLGVVQKQVQSGKANPKLVKTTLNSAATVLDNYISETLNKDSKVVENWVDALFLQNIDFKYDEGLSLIHI